jgi:hypothetical protein
LRGKSLLVETDFTRERIKRQCQRQIQNTQLRLRQLYLQRVRWPERLEDALEEMLSSFLHDLAAVIELQSGEIPGSRAATIEAAQRLGLPSQVLRDLLEVRQGGLQPGAEELKKLYGNFISVVDQTQHLLEKL